MASFLQKMFTPHGRDFSFPLSRHKLDYIFMILVACQQQAFLPPGQLVVHSNWTYSGISRGFKCQKKFSITAMRRLALSGLLRFRVEWI